MRKEYLISIVLLVMLVAFSMPVSAMSSPAIINVPSDSATIQDAINAAKPGDTIHVDSGVYREHVIVNKTVSLIGVGSFSTFIDGMGTGDVVKINASCVLVKGFTIRNGSTGILIKNGSYNTIIENEITAVNFGLTLYDSCYGNSIIDNKVTSCSTGIWVWYSNSNLISDNYIANIGNQGIDIAHSDCNRVVNNTLTDANCGILTRSCTGNSIIDNYISENRYGIMIGWGTGYEANDHIVSCNTIISNTETGILMYAGRNNTFCYNAITNNAKGITTWSSGNSFYHNTIIANSVQVDPAGNVNTWHEGYPSGGNYWSDHPYPVDDSPTDGICDLPYDINMLNKDIYPLCNPLPKPVPGGKKWTVGPEGPPAFDYSSIQDALNALTTFPGDTIEVHQGVYHEHVVINKPISLIGVSPCFINGDGTGVVVKINASNVLIEGFIIWNGTTGIAIEDCSCDVITNNQVTNNNDFGISIADSMGNTITKNFITQSSEGIWIWYSNSNLISDNYIADMGNNGIDIGHSDCNWVVNNIISDANTGLLTHSCVGNSIIDNYIHGNRYGIMIGFGAGYEANDHIISCNTITNNDERGILIRSGSSNNTICCNAITGNDIGVWIRSANDNAICHNNFIANPTQVDTADSINMWYEDYPSGGNYWSDNPNPVDTNDDGICDVPYDITMLQKDIYPLCSPLPKPLKTFFIASFMTPEGEPYPFDVIISNGTWRKEWKNVTYIETEVPCNATYTTMYEWDRDRKVYRSIFGHSITIKPGEVRTFEIFAHNPESLVELTTPYISFREVGANENLSWEWNSTTLTLNATLSKDPDKYVGVYWILDENIYELPNYAISQFIGSPIHLEFCWDSEYDKNTGTKTKDSAHGSLDISVADLLSWFVKSKALESTEGAFGIYGLFDNGSKIGPFNTTLHTLIGEQKEQKYIYPQYAETPGHYLLRILSPEGYTDFNLPIFLQAAKVQLTNVYPPKEDDLQPFTFSIAGENQFAHSSYSNLVHDEENKKISVNVSTETDYDWWGYFVLPDNFTVAAARSYDGLVWHDLDELYDYTINLVDGYKIVVVRITPETEQLMLKYSPVPIPVLAFYPPEVNIPLYSTRTVNLTLSSAPNGLSGYNLTVPLSNSSIAEILSVNFPDWATLYDNSMLPSDSVWIKAADLNDQIKRGESNITLAMLTIRGDKRGKSGIITNVTKIDDDDGNPIYPISIPGQVNVVPSCGITFLGCANPPTDPDNDGLCEDTNGNGRKDFYDVIVFFKNLEWVEENQPIECYDFNGNGRIDFNDIVKLFEEI